MAEKTAGDDFVSLAVWAKRHWPGLIALGSVIGAVAWAVVLILRMGMYVQKVVSTTANDQATTHSKLDEHDGALAKIEKKIESAAKKSEDNAAIVKDSISKVDTKIEKQITKLDIIYDFCVRREHAMLKGATTQPVGFHAQPLTFEE